MSQQLDLKKLIFEHRRRIQKLKEQQARLGINTPPEILIEIEDIVAEIKRLQTELETTESLDSPEIPIDLPPLPPKSYGRFIGRNMSMSRMINYLKEPNRKSIIAVIGVGGIGKTALVREVAERCLQENFFNHVAWVNFGIDQVINESINKSDESHFHFNDLLNIIGSQCHRPDIISMSLNEKQVVVTNLLAKNRLLIVIDNLETVPHSEELVATVSGFMGQSKLIISSRHQIKNEGVLTLGLSEFPKDEGLIFLLENSKERGLEVVTKASHSQLIEIYQMTGGVPLAMKLIIGQMSHQPMEAVFIALRQAAFKGHDYQFYHFVYSRSWEFLDMDARKLLVAMSVFPAGTGGAVVDVQAISQLEPSAFWPAMDQLVNLSLVDKTELSDQERYTLHPLTQYFIRSTIIAKWS